jgi:hypothetical protein
VLSVVIAEAGTEAVLKEGDWHALSSATDARTRMRFTDWDLRADDLTRQSDETVTFLCQLFSSNDRACFSGSTTISLPNRTAQGRGTGHSASAAPPSYHQPKTRRRLAARSVPQP